MKTEDFEKKLETKICEGCYFRANKHHGCIYDPLVHDLDRIHGDCENGHIYVLKLTEDELKQLDKEL